MKKLFRFHRGSLGESRATTIEVSGFAELLDKVIATYGDSISNVKIQKKCMHDPRLPKEWNETSFCVVADFDGYKEQCIGMSNFYEFEPNQDLAKLALAVRNMFSQINPFH